jgi:hypothetical protein
MKRNMQNHKTRGYKYTPRTAILGRASALAEAKRIHILDHHIAAENFLSLAMEKLR